MANERILINPENWVNDELMIEVDRTRGYLEVNGYSFKVYEKTFPDLLNEDGEVDLPGWIDYVCYPVSDNGVQEEYPIAKACNPLDGHPDGSQECYAFQPDREGGIEREDADPYVALAKIIANVL